MADIGLEIDSLKRADTFLREAIELKKVYYLKKDEGVEVFESNDFEDEEGNSGLVIVFWSESCLAYARALGEGLEVQELDLEKFKEAWLKGMEQDGVVAGLNWDQNGIGVECLPLELLEKISSNEMGKESLFTE